MKSIKRIVGVAVIIAAVAVAAVSCGMVQKTPEAVQKTVVGKVNNKNITVADIEPQMQQVYSILSQQVQGNLMDNPEAKKIIIQQRQNAVENEIIQDIVNNQIIAQKITISDAQVQEVYDQELEPLLKKYGKEDGQKSFDEYLQSQGYTEATYKEEIKKELEVKALIANMTKDVKVTEADAQTYYNENKDTLYTKQPGAEVYDIVVNTQEQANQIRDEYLKETQGMTSVESKLKVFSSLASKYNIDSSKSSGGLLGYIPYNSTTYQAPFMDAVKSIKAPGDISEVVENKGANGNVYNIAFVSSINTQATVQPFDQVKSSIMEKLLENGQNAAVTKQMDAWKQEAGAEVYTKKLDYSVPTSTSNSAQQQSGGAQEQNSGTPATN